MELGRHGGFGMAIATAANLQSIAYALQQDVGYRPDQINVALFSENGAIKVLVTGSGGQRVNGFEQLVEQHKGESVIDLLHRAALIGMARVDPYLTALSLMQRHETDTDFSDAETLIIVAKGKIAPTPLSFDRSLFENLQGILALFRGNQNDAYTWFRLANASNPDNIAAVLNLAFADLQLDQYREAADRMERLLHDAPDCDATLASTGYVTWAAALLGMHDVNGADDVLAKAIAIKPTSSIAWDMWSEVKRQKGDTVQAARLNQQALSVAGTFENYAEIAALYFQLTWQDRQPVMRSRFTNPPATRLH